MGSRPIARPTPLGPLAALVGVWEGAKGTDVAPGPDRASATSPYRERMTFEDGGRVDNHEQTLHVLRYTTTAWRIDAADPFHEECGYWQWDASASVVLCCFVVPRGITVVAGGTAAPDARQFSVHAEAGNVTHGITSSDFLAREFKTLRFERSVILLDDDTLHYEQDTVLQMNGKPAFHHTDANTLHRIK